MALNFLKKEIPAYNNYEQFIEFFLTLLSWSSDILQKSG